MKRVLVIATVDWAQITRLCLVLADGGFKVRALAPDHHRLHKMRTIDAELLSRTRTAALHSISRTIERFLPAVVVPGDERAIDYMHALYMRVIRGHDRRARLLAELIETSLGAPSSFVFARQRSRFVQLAYDERLLVPATAVVEDVQQLQATTAGARFPLVLKRDERSGGEGVRIVTNAREAERNFLELRRAGGSIKALMLHEAAANARLVTRKLMLELHTKGDDPPSLWSRLRAPNSGIGPSWRSWFFTNCATIFHRLPESRRLEWVQTHLGPAGGWFMTDLIGRVPQLLGYTPTGAEVVGNRVRLKLATDGGHYSHTIEADHVIAVTGYRPKLDRLTFIQPRLRASISMVVNTPILSSHFQSSVAGLYFVGPIAANSFGPLMRFAFGAKYTARRLSQHLAATTEKVRLRTQAAAGMGELRTGHPDASA
jgi:hypothetical protein